MTTSSNVRRLFPIVFVPADGAGWDLDYQTALDTAVDTALAWWAEQIGVRPFDAVPAIAIGGMHTRAYYTAAPDTQERIRAELAVYYPELRQADERDDGIVYAVYACLSSDPYTCPGDVIGASSAPARGGDQGDPSSQVSGQRPSLPVLIVQSSGSLDAFALGQNPLDPNSGSRAAQTGALAHELGHALGLPHPALAADRAVSVMWSWWTFPSCGLASGEAEVARAGACGAVTEQPMSLSATR
jgi:hypothetical protein